jgi:hypothetical protein
MIKIAIVVLVISTPILFIIMLAAITHIFKIQKELAAISKEQSDQNQDIRRLIIRLNETNLSLNNITEYLSDKSIARHLTMYSGPMGEA